MNHLQALILFWTLTGITVVSWGYAIFLIETGAEITQLTARVLTITSLFFLPVMILFPLIGSGYFMKKEITK